MAGGTYIVLRVSGDTPRSRDPFAEPVMRGEPGVGGRESLEGVTVAVSTETLSSRNVRDLRRDPKVKGAVPPIPVQLIRPVSDAEAGARLRRSRAPPGVCR